MIGLPVSINVWELLTNQVRRGLLEHKKTGTACFEVERCKIPDQPVPIRKQKPAPSFTYTTRPVEYSVDFELNLSSTRASFSSFDRGNYKMWKIVKLFRRITP